MLGTLFTLPPNSVLLGAIGSSSSPIVSDFIPLIELVVGIAFAIFIVYFIITSFTHRGMRS